MATSRSKNKGFSQFIHNKNGTSIPVLIFILLLTIVISLVISYQLRNVSYTSDIPNIDKLDPSILNLQLIANAEKLTPSNAKTLKLLSQIDLGHKKTIINKK